jgi:hypothetical protein
MSRSLGQATPEATAGRFWLLRPEDSDEDEDPIAGEESGEATVYLDLVSLPASCRRNLSPESSSSVAKRIQKRKDQREAAIVLQPRVISDLSLSSNDLECVRSTGLSGVAVWDRRPPIAPSMF